MKILAMGTVKSDPHLYCGDECGRGCTHEEYNRALSAAVTAESTMPGWTANVWENMGWHWNLKRETGVVHWVLHVNDRGRWECYNELTQCHRIHTVGCDTPQEAVQQAIYAAAKLIRAARHELRVLSS